MSKNTPIVIITGGARGIGFGIGECFAKAGYGVVVADVNADAAKAAAQQLLAAGAPTSLGLACDVTDRASIDKMVAQVVAQCGRIDALVNNAGICPFVDAMEMTPEVWQKTLDVDLTGPFHCTQAVAKHMIARGQGGRIVNITSMADTHTNANQVDYAAAKSGLRMMTVGFAIALGPHGITSNAVAPGHVLTDMTKHHWSQPGPAQYIKTRVPVGRMGRPQDIGHACVFLASPQAEYINGITIRVDGGFIARND